MAETQPGGKKDKEHLNALAADVSNSSIQGAEKTALEFVDLSEFYEESVAQVLPLIAEEASTHILEKPKKPRRPRKKKKKNVNTTEQALQMQPANINNAFSSAGDKMKVNFIHEPSTSQMKSPDNIKPPALSYVQGIPETISNQEPTTEVVPVIAEVLTNIIGKPKKPKKPRGKKNKKKSNITAQALQKQPVNNNTSSSTHDKMQVPFIPEPCTSKINPPKNIKPLTPSVEQGVSEAIPYQDPLKQVLPVIAEEVSSNTLRKLLKPKKARRKNNNNNSDTTEEALQMEPLNIEKASSSSLRDILVRFIQEVSSKTTIYHRKFKKISKRGVLGTQVLPVITEETSEDILEIQKKQRKPRKKKNKKIKNKKSSSTVKEAIQTQAANMNGASSSAEKIQQTSKCNVENPKLVETQDPKAIDYGKNVIIQKSERGHQTNKVLVAIESKQQGQKNSKVNNNTNETKTEKVFLPVENVEREEDEKPQISKDAMQETYEKAEGGAPTPVPIHYFPTKAAGNEDEKPQTSKYTQKESNKKAEGNAEAQVQRHLLFFREFYDHTGRLCVRNFNERKLSIDGLYSQVKLASLDHAIKDKIEEAIHSIMNDITIDFKDFRVPIQKLENLFYSLHDIIYMRLFGIGLTELASFDIGNILAIYRSRFKRADDIRLLYSLMSSEDLKNLFY